jgi:hypothetical protein
MLAFGLVEGANDVPGAFSWEQQSRMACLPTSRAIGQCPFLNWRNSWSGVISENHGITYWADDCERTLRQPLRRNN